MGIKKIYKGILAVVLMAMSLVLPTGCKKEMYDYVADVKFSNDKVDWKTSNFMETGIGVVTLANNVDGDTAHFYTNYKNNSKYKVEGRFNGINTPESTGIIEEWGKKASKFTANILNNAKTILLETERDDGILSPKEDGNTGRYLVWVWTSTRELADEDGSQLRLLNLDIVQNGFSFSSSNAGSKYEDIFLDADAQAQKLKLHIWSGEKDDEFYYGEAKITDMRSVFANPAEHLGEKVYVEGVVTRTIGNNAYIQETYYNDDGTTSTYGAYIFTQYKSYSILKSGNRIGVVGTVAEHYGSYQLIDVSYNENIHDEDDMVLLEQNVKVEPQEITVEQALTGNYLNTLCTIKGLVATGGYGGLDEIDNRTGFNYENNAMTIYVKEKDTNQEFYVRIDSNTFIKDLDDEKIKTYTYFKNYCDQDSNNYFDFTGIIGKYENLSDEVKIQLMLISTKDMVYQPTN